MFFFLLLSLAENLKHSDEDCLKDNFYCQWFLSYYKLSISSTTFPFFLFAAYTYTLYVYRIHASTSYPSSFNVIMILWNKSNSNVCIESILKENESIADNVFRFLFFFCTCRLHCGLIIISKKAPEDFYLKQCHFVDLFFFLVLVFRWEENFITLIFMCALRLQTYTAFLFSTAFHT